MFMHYPYTFLYSFTCTVFNNPNALSLLKYQLQIKVVLHIKIYISIFHYFLIAFKKKNKNDHVVKNITGIQNYTKKDI